METLETLKEKLFALEDEKNKVSKELIEKINNPHKIRAVKRLSLKLHNVSSDIIKLKDAIASLDLEDRTKLIENEKYTILIVDGVKATITKKNTRGGEGVSLNYIYMDKLLIGNQVYSCYKRSNGLVNDEIDIYEKDLRWARYKGSIPKHTRAEIALAEEELMKHISFAGGTQIV